MKRKVFYHYPCADGAFSALAVYIGFGDDDIDYIGLKTTLTREEEEKLLNTIQSTHIVYLLDYMGTPWFFDEVAKRAEEVILIDHHKSAIDYFDKWRCDAERPPVPSNVETTFAHHSSACTMALRRFRGSFSSRKITTLFDYVEDNDLWHHKLKQSKEFTAGLSSLRLEYDYQVNPSIFTRLLALDANELIERGNVMEENEKKINALLHPRLTLQLSMKDTIYCCAVEIAPEDAIFTSDLGHKLAELSLKEWGTPFGAVCSSAGNGMMKVSLRALGGHDSTEISKRYGGGGHAGASGFTISVEKFNQLVFERK
jgi:hypothetical protein